MVCRTSWTVHSHYSPVFKGAAEVDYRIDPNAGGLGITSTAYLQSRITNDGFRAHRTPPDW
ncbi:MAG: hypothetical protein CM15mP89_4490 [Gammaproteobacteria bacterium]|nr:MAG: hypothetical protein CM15mP89_4490 [Gammaproteobacteria bacterium]